MKENLIKLVQLSGNDLDEALKIPYVSEEEEDKFVNGAIDTYKKYFNFVKWIQILNDDKWVTCGLISYGIEEDEEFPGFWIQRLMIHPDFRKKRIATNILKFILKEAPPNIPIWTTITEENELADYIFKKFGFVVIKENWEGEKLLKYENTKVLL